MGRKPLILAKACILGALLPATGDPEADLAVFEKLMAIDDEAFVRRGFVTGARQTYDLKRKRRIVDTAVRRVFAVEVRETVYDEKRKRRYRYGVSPSNPRRSTAWMRIPTADRFRIPISPISNACYGRLNTCVVTITSPGSPPRNGPRSWTSKRCSRRFGRM